MQLATPRTGSGLTHSERALTGPARRHVFDMRTGYVATVAQLVRAPVCGTGGRGFELPRSPHYPFPDIFRFTARRIACANIRHL